MVQTIGPGGLPSAKSQREVKTIKGVAGKSTLHFGAVMTRIGNTLTCVLGEGHQKHLDSRNRME